MCAAARTGCPARIPCADRSPGPYARCCATIRKPPMSSSPNAAAPMTAATFRKLLARAGDAAKLGMPIHPHMLRHSTGFKLANDGQDIRAIQHYLGYKNIQHTVLYTQLDSTPSSTLHPARLYTQLATLHPARTKPLQRLLERLTNCRLPPTSHPSALNPAGSKNSEGLGLQPLQGHVSLPP
jgi:Phage integrase family